MDFTMTRDTQTAAPSGDEIHCDADACTARLLARTDLTQAASVDFARANGWQAWLGTMRAYHRCPAHFAPLAAGMPENRAGLPQERAERSARGTEPPGAENAADASLCVSGGMQNPHAATCRDASCASRDFEHEVATRPGGGE